MSREVRRVPYGWDHPKEGDGCHKPMFQFFQEALDDFKGAIESDGWIEAVRYYGGGPIPDNYMPDWTDAEATHYQMYESTSEGTPISPVIETPEKLAQWLVDNNASSFADCKASYEQWLRVCKGEYMPSAVIIDGNNDERR